MKYSRQRELIYQTVVDHPIHPTADTVYAMVREMLPNISLATVYRNLNLLAERGELLKISLPNVSDHFDGNLVEHNHMLCEVCGHVFDVDIPLPEGYRMEAGKASSFQITGCHVYFTGLCGECCKSEPCWGNPIS